MRDTQGLGCSPRHDRQPSPAFSDTSELTMLSRSPSPPPGFPGRLLRTRATAPMQATSTESCDGPERGSNGRFLPRLRKRAEPSLVYGPRKKPCVTAKSLGEAATPKNAPNSHLSRRTCKTLLNTSIKDAGGAGDLGILPKETRQQIFAYVLQIDQPVRIKECCGPTSTRRERAACKKHGDRDVKIGKNNGLVPYAGTRDAKKVYGQFSILCVSRLVNEEAAWVLYNQGTVRIKALPSLQPYLSGKNCRYFRLPSLPTNEHAKRMWMTAGRFRNVCFELPQAIVSTGNPVEYTYHLCEAVSLLLKAWDLQLEKPSSSRPCTVEVQLNSLYTGIIPFNCKHYSEMAMVWMFTHAPVMQFTELKEIGEEAGRNIERLVDIIGRHRRLSEWKIVAESPRERNEDGKNDEEEEEEEEEEDAEDGALARLCDLRELCRSNNVEFETTVPQPTPKA